MVYEHAKKGDQLARELLEETGRYLAVSLGNVLNMLDLETIILGGQVSQAAEFFFQSTIDEVEKRAIRAAYYPLKIVPAQLGNHAGIIGAAKTAFDHSRES
jgi:glucokinase